MHIGQDHAELIFTRECVTGSFKSPILSKKYIDWVVHGTIAGYGRKINENPLECNCIHDNMDDDLHQMIKDPFSTEFLRVTVTTDTLYYKEDR